MASILKSASAEAPSTSAGRSTAGLSSFNLQDLLESGRKQIEEAKREAERIIQEARSQATELTRAATEKGRRDGLQLGHADFRKEVDSAARKLAEADLAALRSSVEQLWSQETEWLHQWRDLLSHSVLEICERIVGYRMSTDNEILIRWATEAIEMSRAARSLTIAVHPEVLIRIGDRLEQLLKSGGAPEDSRLEPDETLSQEGVVVRQLGGRIDLQLKTQLSRFSDFLHGTGSSLSLNPAPRD